MRICPKCGKVLSYNSYFGAYICDNCNWEKKVRTAQKVQVFRYVNSGVSREQFSGKTVRPQAITVK